MRISISVVSGLSALLLAGNALWAQTVEPRDVARDAQASAATGAAAIAADETPRVGRNIELKPQANRPAAPRAAARQPEPANMMYRWRGFGARTVTTPTVTPPSTSGRGGWLGTTPQQRYAAKTFFGMYNRIPRETVSFRENYSPGTIIVKTGERRLY